MDEDEKYINHRNLMLGRFRESLKKPLSERFFDEDDLIEIFDYAGDTNDDYLRMEVLMVAARFYPDSDELNQRRGFFYSDYSEDTRNKFLDDNPECEGIMWDILRVRKANPRGPQAIAALDGILASVKGTRLADEELIRLVQLAGALGCMTWLFDKQTDLRALTDYPAVVIYETAVAADIAGMRAECAALLEELTAIEPFNSYYWQMLGREYDDIGEYDKAENAVEYALAINPNDPMALYAKAKVMYSKGEDVKPVIEMLRRAIDNKPETSEPLRFLAIVYGDNNQPRMVDKTLRRAIEEFPDEAISLLPQLIQLNPKDVDDLLDRFFTLMGEPNEEMWNGWAQNLLSQGLVTLADNVMRCYERNTGTPLSELYNIEKRFKNGDMDGAIEKLSQYLTEHNVPDEADFCTVITMNFLMLVHAGEIIEAFHIITHFNKSIRIDMFPTISGRNQYLGVQHIFALFRQYLADHPDNPDWTAFDPLRLWSK